jgi:hypothetical protein
VDWRSLLAVVVIGVCVGISTGVLENRPSQVGLPEYKKYGYPLAWRFTQTNMPDKFGFFELFLDCFFWFVIVLVVVFLVKRLTEG